VLPVTGTTLLRLLTPDADEARRLLEEELAGNAYVEAQPGIFERILADVLRGLARLLDGFSGLGPGPGTLVLAVGAAFVIAVAVLLIKPRPNARGRHEEPVLFDDGERRSARQHRTRAAEYAANGDWNGAVAELLRAVIRSAEERVVIDEQPGRTATEAGIQLGTAFPGDRADITWLAELFNETHYGSGTASGDDHRRAAALDTHLSAGRPTRSPASTAPAAPQ
jgi:hypothetical protein